MSTVSIALSERKNKKEISWYNLSQEDIFARLATGKNGLDDGEVKKRQTEFGPNKLPESKGQSKFALFIKQFKSSLIYLLLLASLITLLLRDYPDALIIMAAVLINVLLGFYEENKAANTFQALKRIVVNYATVLRLGGKRQIKTDEVTIGDLVYLTAGDKIPADLRLIKANNLKINEAALTGEANQVEKVIRALAGELILADQLNMAFLGTEVTTGSGLGIVIRIGQGTAMGKIAELIQTTENVVTPLQHKLNSFAKKISLIVVVVCFIILMIGLSKGYNFTQIFTTAVAIAVSAVPEGLLVVVTMILALGMRKILQQKSLVKHLLAAEILGSTSVIATDKTGTLTEGEMRVAAISTLDYNLTLSDETLEKNKALAAAEIWQLLKIAVLCNNSYVENNQAKLEHRIIRGNPTEKALLLAGASLGFDKINLEKIEPRLDEIPFDSAWKFMMTLHKGSANEHTIYLKGAPETVLNLTKYIYSKASDNKKVELNKETREKLIKIYREMSSRGLRVLAAAYNKVGPEVKNLKVLTEDFVFVGFIGLKDPVRSGVKETIEEIGKAGIRTVMITGDHELTARAIGAELGLPSNPINVISGLKLNKMSESDLLKKVKDLAIYARVTPADKLKVIRAWQELGEVVAMTGDGLNDAPALKKANIGIAVGSATDVAKETADMIILDNNFKTIVAAVKEGRVIYENIKKVILYFLSDSFSEMITIGLSLLLNLPLPLTAAQIIWINLVDDTLPALAMAKEPAAKNILLRQPRKINEPIIDQQGKFLIGLISLFSALGTLGIFWFFSRQTDGLALARTASFSFLALSTLIYIFSIKNLSTPLWKYNFFNNKFLLGAVASGFILQSLAIYHPSLQPLFQTVALGLAEWLLIISTCLILVIIIEFVKYLYNRKFNQSY